MGLFRTSSEKIGQNNFENCQNRAVEYTDFVQLSLIDVTETDDLSKDARDYSGSSAELHCPRTSDDRVTVEVPFERYQTRADALSKLKREAGAQVCKTCVYAQMDPLQVVQYDGQIAHLEREKIEDMKARALALAELTEINPAYRHDT